MKKTADTFFTDQEKKRIADATHQAELRTSGEIAVMVTASSDSYRDAEIIGGIVFGSITAFALTEMLFNAQIWYYIPLSILFFFPFQLLTRHLPLLKAVFIGPGRRQETVAQRALKAYYEKGLYRTRDNTGILFFISILERKVWILADKGIYSKIDQDTLNTYTAAVTQGIKKGEACDALCRTITEIGQLLAEHFPVKSDDTNELPDEVMTA